MGAPTVDLELVAVAWRERRSPRLAEFARALDRRRPSTLSEELARIIGPSVEPSLERLRAVREVDHPLVANFVLEHLLVPPFVGESAAPFLLELISLGLRLRDGRLARDARLISSVLQARLGERRAMPLVAALLNGAAAMPPAPPADTALEQQLEAELAAPGSVDVDRLLADVFEHPADDARRLVLADLLLERGEPRGEFIQLQCRGEEAGRQQALLRKHGKQWLGPLASVVSWNKNATSRFERGFLSVAELTLASRRPGQQAQLRAVAREPQWATVETFAHEVPSVLLHEAPLTGLRAVHLFDAMAQRLVAAGRRLLSLEELTFDWADLDWAVALEVVRQLCPRLRVLRVQPYEGRDPRRPLREVLPQLERLIIDGLWQGPAGAEIFASVVEAVRSAPALIPEVEIVHRVDHRPAQTRAVFHAVRGRYEPR